MPDRVDHDAIGENQKVRLKSRDRVDASRADRMPNTPSICEAIEQDKN